MNPTISLELEDIQGFVIRGYANMQHARYVMLEISNPADTKNWLSEISTKLTTATSPKNDRCLNLALTITGIEKLGLHGKNLMNFSTEFRAGMADPHRSRLLGDLGNSSPDNWRWGGTKTPKVDVLLMVFADTTENLAAYYNELQNSFSASGMKEIISLEGQTLKENREHFGFRDGISQPVIKGSGRTGPEHNMIASGEFILGYENEYGVFPESPLIMQNQGNMNLLAEDANDTGFKDFGRNGTYLVFRQLEQLVDKFWSYMLNHAKTEAEAIKLASKMVGRWPSGAPLVKFPDADPGGTSDDDDFGYRDDPHGFKCPFGSHLRRNNPRDAFEDNFAGKSLQITKRHRIVRRARLYGEPIAGSPFDHKPKDEVGLHFISFQANIGMQFEFLQHTWANYPNFNQLYNDPDPIIGVMDKPYQGYEQNFTVQAEPVAKTYKGLEPFVVVKGGAYFFMPGIMSLRYLATV